jgi:hypothetical protein
MSIEGQIEGQDQFADDSFSNLRGKQAVFDTVLLGSSIRKITYFSSG